MISVSYKSNKNLNMILAEKVTVWACISLEFECQIKENSGNTREMNPTTCELVMSGGCDPTQVRRKLNTDSTEISSERI